MKIKIKAYRPGVILLLVVVMSCSGLVSNASSAIDADRWLEIDLYWFERTDIEHSVNEFWNRFYPLMEDIEGWKGVILNVGWLSDYVLEWNGSLNEKISLPKNMEKFPWYEDGGHLSGNSLEQMEMSDDRFQKADSAYVVNYEEWTYGDLKKLSATLKKVALREYNLKDVKVGTFVLGWKSIYKGNDSRFGRFHPNAFINGWVNLEARLSADDRKYGAFPNGIYEGLPLTDFFGKQWGSLSRTVGLDAIILRDSFLGVGIYRRVGPYGQTAPSDPGKVASWSKATSDLVKQTKIANSQALVIGYSNAASAVADWRVNCMDLESIAGEGFLDAWIDQTWAGAWNEVGQRPGNFWNAPIKGWTYQLSYMLVHAAVLANTKVRHYFLTETFDAWESWDIIHTARERLRWGIWAYSHAAVKKPDGLKMPAGSYISWCNQGKKLLSEEDVQFLIKHTNAAIHDARETKEVLGPTLVYCRSAMEWQSENRPEVSIKEWIDEQAGTLMKWSVPIFSITRAEYLPQVESDMFIFQTPAHLKQIEKKNILAVLKSGRPSVVIGSPVGGLDEDISSLLGVSSKDTFISDTKFIGTTNFQTNGIFHSLPNTFPLFQPFTRNEFREGINIAYSVNNSPCLGYNGLEGKKVIFWDPPEFSVNLYGRKERLKSLDQILGSPVPYVLTARLMNEVMRKSGFVCVDEIKQYQPVSLALWKLNDGTINIMAGNLEEGINHTDNHTVEVALNFPRQFQHNKITRITEKWNKQKIILPGSKMNIRLDQAQTKLFVIKEE